MTRKDELTQALIGYLMEHGLADLSLRPLAAGVGTSARLLVYHFGSKEGLLAEVLGAMHSHVRASLTTLLDTPSVPGGARPPLRRLWDWAVADANYPYLAMLYELQILAARQPATYAPHLRQDAALTLAAALEAMSPPLRSAPMATLCVAVFDGLFLELMSTGDRERTTAALDRFIELATAIPSTEPGSTPP